MENISYQIHKFDQQTAIAEFDITDIDNAKLVELIDEYKNNHKSIESNVNAWHYGWLVHLDSRFDFLTSAIEKCTKIFLKEIYAGQNVPVLYESWIIDYKSLDFTKEHSHFPATLACSYYIETDNDSSPAIVFPHLKKDSQDISFEFIPSTGKLIIFPGHLLHKVKPMLPSRHKTRKVFAANIACFNEAFVKTINATQVLTKYVE
jgi:hypothetical protein